MHLFKFYFSVINIKRIIKIQFVTNIYTKIKENSIFTFAVSLLYKYYKYNKVL